MIVIVDSGATKADWRGIDLYGHFTSCETDGINMSVSSLQDIANVVHRAMEEINPEGEALENVFFYGAGLIAADRRLEKAFGCDCLVQASDMLGAARAVCGRAAGLAAIIGTGSNSCLYDGETIVSNIRSGGFILGDEGSGACLGKMFLSDLVKGIVPSGLAAEFGASHESAYPAIVENVYRSPAPSKYLGSLAPWILEHYSSSSYVHELVDGNFSKFIERSLLGYGRRDLPVGVVGGFAFAAKEIFSRVAERYGLEVKCFLRTPMQGLVEYHYDR